MSEDPQLGRYGRLYEAGEVLFREGDVGHEMYVIQTGEIEISRHIKDRDRIIAVLPAGEFFGEMAIINNRRRSATATVRKPARLLVIDSRTFEAMLRGRVEIAVRLIKTLASRLEQANQQIELLLLKDANHRVVQCLRQLASAEAPEDGDDDAATTVYIPIDVPALAVRVDLTEAEVGHIIERLALARLVTPAGDAGVEGPGFVIPEVGRLQEFLEFLEMKERFGA